MFGLYSYGAKIQKIMTRVAGTCHYNDLDRVFQRYSTPFTVRPIFTRMLSSSSMTPLRMYELLR